MEEYLYPEKNILQWKSRHSRMKGNNERFFHKISTLRMTKGSFLNRKDITIEGILEHQEEVTMKRVKKHKEGIYNRLSFSQIF